MSGTIGWGIYCKVGRPKYGDNRLGIQHLVLESASAVPAGQPEVRVDSVQLAIADAVDAAEHVVPPDDAVRVALARQ